MRRRSGVLVLAAVLAGVVQAFAQDLPSEALTLTWSVPPSCPDSNQVLREVDALLQGGTSATRTPVAARVAIRSVDPNRWEVELFTKSGGFEGERRLTATSCVSASHAVALILAIAIDPAHVVEPVRSAPVGSASFVVLPIESPATRAVPVASASASASASTSVREYRSANVVERGGESPVERPAPLVAPSARPFRPWGIGLTAGLDMGSLPATSVGYGLQVSRRIGKVWTEIEGRYWSKTRGEVASNASLGGDLALWEMGLRAGLVVSHGPYEVVPNLGMMGGVLRGEGVGVDRPSDTWATWFALEPSMDARLLMWGRIGLRLRLGAGVPLRRDRFVLDGIGKVHQAAAVVVRTQLGVEFRF